MDTESLKQKVRGFLGSTSNLISPVKDHDLKDFVSQNGYWKIHDALKKTTNQECSVFIFDKKQNEKISKSNLENITTFLKKEATTLQRLRHPSVLQVFSVLEETKNHIYFATEPILATLEDLINDHRKRKRSTVDSSSTSEEGYKKKDFTFEELEVKSGVFQILDGLFFLNTTAKLLHRNISPESIYVTKSLKWKLGGLGFTCSIETKEPPISNLSLNDLKEYLYQEAHNILPQLDYLSPEFVNQKSFSNNSDLFAVGRLIFEMVLNLDGQAIEPNLKNQMAKLGVQSYYNTMLEQARRQSSLNTQKSDSAKVCTILLGDSSLRGDLDNFIRSSYFNDTLTKTIVYLQNITQKEEESKIRFYRGLLSIVQQFSPRIQTNYILPVLLSELSNDRITYVLFPCIMSICNNHVKKETFQSKIIPAVSHILTSKEPKAEVLTCILDNLSLFITKGSLDSIKRYIIPVILGSLCGPTQEIIYQSLSLGQQILKFFDTETIQSGLIPRLTNLCVGGFPVHIRTKAINWFTSIVPSMDKPVIVDYLIPNLEKILSGDNSPAILEALVQTYDAISKKLGGELLALKVLPALIPLSSDKHLDLQQFKTIMKVIREILNAYEGERINELSNLQRFTKPEASTQASNTENNMFGGDPTPTATSITLPSNFEQQLNNNNNTSKPDPFSLLNNPPTTPTNNKHDPFSSLSPSSATTTNNDPFSSLSPSSNTGITTGTDKSLLSSPDFGSLNRNTASPSSFQSINITLPPPVKPKSPLNNSSNLNKSSNSSIMNSNTSSSNNYNSTLSSLNNLSMNSTSAPQPNRPNSGSIFDFDGTNNNNNNNNNNILKPNNTLAPSSSSSSNKSRYDINLDDFTNSNSSSSMGYNSQTSSNSNLNYNSTSNFSQQTYNTNGFDQVLKPSSSNPPLNPSNQSNQSNQTLSYNNDLSFNSAFDNQNNYNFNNYNSNMTSNNNMNNFYNNNNMNNNNMNNFYNNNNMMNNNNDDFYNNMNNNMNNNNSNNNNNMNNNMNNNNNNNLYNNSKFSNSSNNNNSNNNNFW
ncbi:hypothetical protein DICPUDRAFT_158338 [Dictyostelium purpureum]|uniref:Protein kinase domain-containing protein n=1 Tax=Dictyostelium purpureum TaxID=5786 RepID=F1A1D8_DICPU|nr:uncharacterized protein DICPUDRAFT_158338 [Dictyostelium purpureum]EGC29995.1 hypothetical protein DICPUDRAFT_158338 [Dictyostelium purpureum]|eukprot:XP_003293479.1 hypothetical protein DICPUDRAFT_158338 [Dictyostelium purpureum]